jgi:cytoplasmic iron level regulating protein YaaA (DUF328/UPF0246 family)
VLVLLPPSETKTASTRGAALDLDALSFIELTEHRAAVLDALLTLSRGPATKALQTLKLSAGQTDELARNAALLDAPATRVDRLYTGVLYDNLSLGTLSAAGKRRANRQVVVASALFGALRLRDKVPAYRLSAGVTLPRVGAVTTSWKAPLEAVLPNAAGRGVVLDLRSSGYATMWQPDADLAERTVTMRVLHERRPGDPSSRQVVSHFNKATKGRFVRHLLDSGADPRTAEDLVDVVGDFGATAELQPARRGKPRGVDLIVLEI